ncbi:MAG: hypothetical protein ACRC33_20435 [Gemmataceae bacterium]
MTKRTSRSASVSQTTSAPPGTSDGTGGTGKTLPEPTGTGSPFQYVIDAMREHTPEEHLKILIAAGILNEQGELTPRYSPGARKPKKRSAKKREAGGDPPAGS